MDDGHTLSDYRIEREETFTLHLLFPIHGTKAGPKVAIITTSPIAFWTLLAHNFRP